MTDDAIERLMRPRSIAIVGASTDPMKTAGRPLRYLKTHGFAGTLMPVNPNADSIDGMGCFPNIASLPVIPDAAIVLLDVGRTERAVAELSERGVPAAVVLNGGYGETGPDGLARQEGLRRAAGGMRILGPNTIGLVNLVDRIALSASTSLEVDELQKGGVGLVSQSGGVLGSILSRAMHKGIGFSHLVATGNEADLEASDFVSWLADDPHTKVIALYLETVRDAARFRDAAAKAERAGKPIVAFKVGRSEAGALSAVSHTGALAGADALYEALFRQTGVIRANAFSDLLDIAVGLASGRRLEGKRLGVLTTTGGAGALIADACGVLGFTTPAPDSDTASRLGKLMIGDGAVPDRNPIDLTLAGLRPDIMSGAIGAIMSSPSYDGAVVIVGSSGLDRPDLVANAARENIEKYAAPLAIYVSPSAPHIVRSLNQKGIPAFDTPEGCAAALAALTQPQRSPAAQASNLPAVEITASGKLDEHASKRVLAQFGIHAVEEHRAASPHEAEAIARRIGAPVAIKILSSEIAHKTDVGGVMLDVAPHDVGQRCAELAAKTAGLTGANPEFLVQRFVRGAIEMLLGVVRDDRLGAAIVLGSGGTGTELLDDTSMRMAPLSRGDVEEMIGELRMRPMLFGYRGRAHADVEALIAATLAFSDFVVAAGPRLVEAEINPLFVLPLGEGALAADALLVLR